MNTNPEERKALYWQDPMVARFLNRMPRHVVDSFSELQLDAIRRCIINPQRHAVDLRQSVPFFRKRFYFVVLAGPERRSRERLRQEKVKIWGFGNIAFVSGTFLVFILVLHSLFSLWTDVNQTAIGLNSNLKQLDASSHPTVLPWIEREEDCRGPKREWKQGFCYDSEHSPRFRR